MERKWKSGCLATPADLFYYYHENKKNIRTFRRPEWAVSPVVGTGSWNLATSQEVRLSSNSSTPRPPPNSHRRTSDHICTVDLTLTLAASAMFVVNAALRSSNHGLLPHVYHGLQCRLANQNPEIIVLRKCWGPFIMNFMIQAYKPVEIWPDFGHACFSLFIS